MIIWKKLKLTGMTRILRNNEEKIHDFLFPL